MNSINQEGNLDQKEWNINSNKNFKLKVHNTLGTLKPNHFIKHSALSKTLHLLSPASFSKNQKINQIIIKSLQNRDKLNNTNNNVLNYKFLNTENNFSFERPKVHIKIHSTKHNDKDRNTISSEKSNNPLKYKIHRVKEKNFKSNENKIFSPYKTNVINQKINYTLNDSTPNNFDYTSDNNLSKKKKKEYINLNYYYNMIQQQNLITLNNNIENLIKEQPYTNYIRNNNFKKNNEYFKKLNNEKNLSNLTFNNNDLNKMNHLKKIIYRKKIQKKKNNFSEIFSTMKLLNLDGKSEKKDINMLYKDIKLKDNNPSNIISDNKKYKLIYDNYQTPQKIEILSKTSKEFADNAHCSNNCSFIMPSFTFSEPKYATFQNEQNNKEYIKIENHNNNNLTSNNNNYKLMELLNSNNKKKNTTNIKNLNNCKSAIRKKKILDFSSTKSSSDMLIHLHKNNTNNYYNNTITNLYNAGYSNSISNYNTINTLNSTEKNVTVFNNEINNRLNPNRTLIENNLVSEYNDKNRCLYRQNEILNHTINKIGKQKLKNVITSIEYKNKDLKNNLNNKNIVLSELDKNGKLNVKYRKMKNSIEKIIKQNSIPKIKKVYCMKSSKIPYNGLTYVKKNQGTHIRNSKKYNTIHRI